MHVLPSYLRDANATKFVGLDVHAASIAVAVCGADRLPAKFLAKIPHDVARLKKRLLKLAEAKQLVCCYEAGPTGYGLARALNAAGIACVVVAPSLIPKKPGDRVKTDRRDAKKLAHFLRSGDLTAVRCPDEDDEAMRDLVRAREAAKRSERVARHQLAKFLLRHGVRQPSEIKKRWTKKYFDWVGTLHMQHEAAHRTLRDYLNEAQRLADRVAKLERDLEELSPQWKHGRLVTALQGLRGIKLISAVTLAAELGSLTRFATPARLMSYLGLVVSEHSSGDHVRRGRITRAGNEHARRILVEAAWAYRYQPGITRTLRPRLALVSEEVKHISWRAQTRLHERYTRLTLRGKSREKTIVAIARELAGYVWAVGQTYEREQGAAA